MNDQQFEICQGLVRRLGASDLSIADRARSYYGPEVACLVLLRTWCRNVDMGTVLAAGVSRELIESFSHLIQRPGETYRRFIERLRDSGCLPAMRAMLMIADSVKTDFNDLVVLILTDAIWKLASS